MVCRNLELVFEITSLGHVTGFLDRGIGPSQNYAKQIYVSMQPRVERDTNPRFHCASRSTHLRPRIHWA
jgi:hypothetical protein